LEKYFLISLNISQEEGDYMARVLGLTLGSLPIKYLGIPPGRNAWMNIVHKVESKLL
jgi:hypothetical protein